MKHKNKGFNWKSRSNPEVSIDNSSSKKIVIDIGNQKEHYDDSNALVLPAKKRETKKKIPKGQNQKFLSNKRKKQLEKVLEKKAKKANRAGLLQQLQEVQATNEELKDYVSLTTIQTKGLKRHFRDESREEFKLKNSEINDVKDNDDEEENEEKEKEAVNALKGNKKARLSLLNNDSEKRKSAKSDPNVVGLSSESEDSSTEDEEIEQKNSSKETQQTSNVIVKSPVKKSDPSPSKKQPNSPAIKPTPPAPPKPLEKEKQNLPTPVKEQLPRVPAVFVPLNRKPEIQAARLKLPIVPDEQSIVETINENSVIIVTGETGSGKTTQIPQFLYEAGYAQNKMIGITEPRRVAAMSMSKRVAEEMNLSNDEVSYLIRFEGNTTDKTKIKFMTDGVLLKEIQSDFLLTKYSVIILDEAHERSVYTDILIGLLSRIVPLRLKRNDPLKMIIMSATLRVEDFLDNRRLFKIQPPLIKVESRQHPVTIHHNRVTSENYVFDALKKVVKIHRDLPAGGVLVFLTGQHEVNTVVNKLRKLFPYKPKTQWKKSKNLPEATKEENDNDDDDTDDEMNSKGLLKRLRKGRKEMNLPEINLEDYSVIPTDDTQEDMFESDDNLDEDSEDEELLMNLQDSKPVQPLWVLPLYSLLPSQKQANVFKPIPEGCRLCVVSTNVAETSITIPNIKYVVDSGRCKTRLYDKVTGVSTYKITYTSKASANQRAGRAGRTGPGQCYRLYSSAVFNNDFPIYSQPEIQRKPVDDLILQMKIMNITKVINFPFPSPPDIVQLKTGERRLCILGALEQPPAHKKNSFDTKLTKLGQSISVFPVAPRYGKMLAMSQQRDLLGFTICMVSGLSIKELLIEGPGVESNLKQKHMNTRKLWAGIGNNLLLGDPMVLIKAIGAAEYEISKPNGNINDFCQRHGLLIKAIMEIRKLRQQLTNDISLNIPNLELSIDPNMKPPSDEQSLLLRQIILAGMADQVARKLGRDEIKDNQDKNKFKYAYKTMEMEDPVFMHSTCVLRKNIPEWVVYQEVYETNKMYMRGITAIEPEWLPKFAPTLCRMSEPLMDPPPRYDAESGKIFCHMTGTFGPAAWELPAMELEFPATIDGVKWFARFLLAGDIFPKLKRFVSVLITEPRNMTKSWAVSIARVDLIAKQLLSNGIMSKEKLIEAWKNDDKFLLNVYKKWLPESAHQEVSKLWPPM